MNNPIYYILSALAALIALTIHEFSHAYAAYKMGDDTAKNFGRLTLNPIKHIDPIGAICMIFLHVGWAKPVPINMRNFKNPRKGFAITAAAGPLSNLILAFVSALLYLLFYALVRDVRTDSDFVFNLIINTLIFLSVFHSINIGLAIFNLLPIPPLDGSRLLGLVLPEKIYYTILKYEQKIYYGVLAWLLVGDYVAYGLRSIPLIAASPVLNFIVGIFSLSDMLGAAISFISGLMFDFWQLIPFLR
ncbi:MAG: site-2 protease family protein [Clostridia bacterium]|nr:site-2 protease family protein [Clostridia bacterium]